LTIKKIDGFGVAELFVILKLSCFYCATGISTTSRKKQAQKIFV